MRILIAFVALVAGSANSARGQGAPPVDAGAGNWRMIVLTGPTQFPVAAPAPVTDAAYVAELTSIKTAQGQLTREQQKAIEYWGRGGILRWNEIQLELVSRADLPPAPSADGTYPVPDANNPFADPQFPFGNPPYAARAYSYVAVAQYEALKAAWHYKYLYNRPSPAKVDTGIRTLLPLSDLPAYPSEDAVISGVTAELLKLLFPTSVEQITRMAAEERQAALLSGRATASDIAAGLALGQAVAAAFAARAATDGMRTAGGTPAQTQAMSDAAVARGEIPWKSLESPPRPPMLPLFGRVTAWMMTPADVAAERPGSPPSTSSAAMASETEEVRQAVNNLTRSQLAIVYKWADGVSTPTPPGHWNFIAAPYLARANWSEVRAARAFALLNMAMHDAAVSCWDAKFAYYNPRPSQLDSRIKTVIGLPNFPSYISGHSTFSAAAAVVLAYLFPDGAAYFDAQKEEAAISRLYGGIHYRADIDVGKVVGSRVGGYTLRFARQDGADGGVPTPSSAAEVLDAASLRSPVSPGSIASVFGADLDGDVALAFNDSIPAPVLSRSAGQLTIQAPWELRGLASAMLTIRTSKLTVTQAVALSDVAPAIFSVNQQGSGQGLVTIGNTATIAAAAGSIPETDARPVARGEHITIYCLGLGPVMSPPATGEPARDSSSVVDAPVTVVLNEDALAAEFSGLVPGQVGLFQVNVRIPDDAPSGVTPIALRVRGAISNTVTIVIQ